MINGAFHAPHGYVELVTLYWKKGNFLAHCEGANGFHFRQDTDTIYGPQDMPVLKSKWGHDISFLKAVKFSGVDKSVFWKVCFVSEATYIGHLERSQQHVETQIVSKQIYFLKYFPPFLGLTKESQAKEAMAWPPLLWLSYTLFWIWSLQVVFEVSHSCLLSLLCTKRAVTTRSHS